MQRKPYIFALIVLLFCIGCQKSPPQDYSNIEEVSWLIQPRYEWASGFGEEMAAVEQEDGSYHFINKRGENVFGQDFDWIERINSDEWVFINMLPEVKNYPDQQSYLLGKDGKPYIPQFPIEKSFRHTGTTQQIAQSDNGLKGVIDQLNQWIIPPIYKNVSFSGDGIVRIYTDDLAGFVKENGEIVFVKDVSQIQSFNHGVARVHTKSTSVFDSGYNFIDESGKFLFTEPFSESAEPNYAEGIAVYKEGEKYGFISPDGSVNIPPMYFKYTLTFQQGLAAVTNEKGKIGYINTSGSLVIPFMTGEYGGRFEGELASFSLREGKEGLIDQSGNWVVKPQYDSCLYDEKYKAWEMIKDRVSDVYFVETGLLVKGTISPTMVNEATIISYGDKESYLIKLNNGKAEWKRFESLGNFYEGLAVAEENGLLGYINLDGEWILKPQFDYADRFFNGIAAVSQNGKWGYIKTPLQTATNTK